MTLPSIVKSAWANTHTNASVNDTSQKRSLY